MRRFHAATHSRKTCHRSPYSGATPGRTQHTPSTLWIPLPSGNFNRDDAFHVARQRARQTRDAKPHTSECAPRRLQAEHDGERRSYSSANGETYSLCLSSAGRQIPPIALYNTLLPPILRLRTGRKDHRRTKCVRTAAFGGEKVRISSGVFVHFRNRRPCCWSVVSRA